MSITEQIQSHIQSRFGFIPSLFIPAQQNPQALENLWRQTLAAYLENPLPTLFKEKLFTYLSRYCSTPYSLICHSCTLYSLEMPAVDVLALLERPVPTRVEMDRHLQELTCEPRKLILSLGLDSELERGILACCTFIFLDLKGTDNCRKGLRQLIGLIDYQHIVTLIAYIQTCHQWVAAHPEINYKSDWRVQMHLDALLKGEPKLAKFFASYHERMQQKFRNRAQPKTELASGKADQYTTQYKQTKETLQQYASQLEQMLKFDSLLKRITDKVRDSLSESQILTTAVQELATGLGVEGCDTALYDLEQGTSTISYDYYTEMSSFQGYILSITDYPNIHTQLLQGECFQFCLLPDWAIYSGANRAILACPISDEHSVLGDLWLFAQCNYIFNAFEIRLVEQVANQCAIAIRQARLYQSAQAQVSTLEQLHRLKDDFLSTVSHELRSPLANIRMAIQMLKIASSPSQQKRYLKILETESDREAELINNLLDLQQLEAGTLPISFESLNLQDWLPSVIEPFRLRTEKHQQTLRAIWADDLPAICSNQVSLGRILAELLNNACKYTPSNGEICLNVTYNPCPVKVSSATSTITFTVSNQAEIPAAELPHIFKKLYRVPQKNPWKYGGTGLGLALVQKLVEALAGSIKAESSEGWTRFVISLPKNPNSFHLNRTD